MIGTGVSAGADGGGTDGASTDGASGAGPTNSLADIAGLRAGHASRTGDGWLTGTTVVVCDGDGAVAGADVRGGGPGTRETDLLDPRAMVQRVHAIVLGGGSAFGLAAADGVMNRLAGDGRGFRISAGSAPPVVVPIVPAAILFDLGRGGDPGCRPDAEFGARAYDDALRAAMTPGAPALVAVPAGNVGAGTGALAGGLKGGIGSASALVSGSGVAGTVAALVAVNARGSTVDPGSGSLYGAAFGLPGEFDWLRPPEAGDLRAATATPGLLSELPARPLNTTIGVVATDVPLTKAQCAKIAAVAHDGMARAIRPSHLMSDGDTVFGLSTGRAAAGGEPAGGADHALFNEILIAAADCFCRAVVRAMLSARTVTTPAGTWRSYLDVFPSATGSPGAGD
ncbi:MAG TPA: P1 family peptidase [Trebonia sp.]